MSPEGHKLWDGMGLDGSKSLEWKHTINAKYKYDRRDTQDLLHSLNLYTMKFEIEKSLNFATPVLPCPA